MQSAKPFILFALLSFALSYGVIVGCADDTVIRLGREDGLFEYLSSLFFAIAGGVLLWTYVKRPSPNDFFVFGTKRNVFFLLLGLLFLFAAGEEISWGQRIFGIETPESMSEANMQGEINIHNLAFFHQKEASGEAKSGIRKLLSVEGMFALFWGFYCFLIPLAASVLPWFASLLRRVGLPVVPVFVGLFFPLNYGVSKVIEKTLVPHSSAVHWPSMEIKEAVFAALFLLVAIAFLRGLHRLGPREDVVLSAQPTPSTASS